MATVLRFSAVIAALISFLIIALVLYLIWWVIGRFVGGVPHQILGAILALCLLLYALRIFGGVIIW